MIKNTQKCFLIADDHSIIRQGFIYIIKERLNKGGFNPLLFKSYNPH